MPVFLIADAEKRSSGFRERPIAVTRGVVHE